MIAPEIRQFVDAVTAAYARHPDFDTLPMYRKRAIADATRAPWCAGGPAMHRTWDAVTPGLGVRVRVHDPAAGSPKPAIVYMHGGGWTIFSVRSHDRLMREYAARTGAMVVGVDYSLAPEVIFPRQIEEVVDVVHWLANMGEEMGVDPGRLALAGDSAGANLALAAALVLRDAGTPDAVRALILNYGAFDMDFTRASYHRFGDGSYLLSSAEMAWMWSQYLGPGGSRDDPLACPLRAELTGLPPCFLAIAESDILHDENVAMASRLHAAAVHTHAKIYPGTVHGFLEAVAIAPVSAAALDDTAQWLAAIFDR
jgi:acetyl esterase